ncbi:MAG TPA: ROK family protein [Steroidobacteraceae bacterium]|nr:ROK family protein [Steroidobacteraceae bacterium]
MLKSHRNVARNLDDAATAPRSGRPRRRAPDDRRILVIDIGGSHVKFRLGAHGEIRKFVSGPGMTAAVMARKVRKLAEGLPYEAVSIGYPGLVLRGRIAAEPFNLGPGWVGYDFAKAFGRPTRVINDATMQALGSYAGGRMLFLGLGTGLGATLILDETVEPMEIGHMPYKHGRTFEDEAGERGRRRLGNRKWRKAVADVVTRLKDALEVDYVVVGGGNARRLKELPEGARPGDNLNAFTGGLRMWAGLDHPAIGAKRYESC